MILVTGATGFIGQHLVRRLLSEGYEVTALIHKKPMSLISYPHLKMSRGDLELGKIEIPHEVDIVVHLAGVFNEDRAIQANAITTQNLLSTCARRKVGKVIFSSSYAVYGETPLEGASEFDATVPTTMYGLSKLLAELIVKFYSLNYAIPSIILRLSSVYGPGNVRGVVHDFLDLFKRSNQVTIHGDGKQVRDFLYVDDAIDGIIRAIDYEPKNFEIFNISTGVGYTLLQPIEAIERILILQAGKVFEAPRKPDVRCLVAKNERAKQLLGFKPTVPLYDGLKRLTNYKN